VPLQNRVTPAGELVADAGRGLMMGNRGCLHGPDRQLGTARWRSQAWICCVLEWRGVRRDPMPPGRWTALFFLDEATALAANSRRRWLAYSSASMPAAWMSNGRPPVISASQTSTARFHGIQIS